MDSHMTKTSLIVPLLSVLLFAGCGKKTESESETPKSEEKERGAHTVHLDFEKRALANIKVEPVELKPLKESITVPGRIDFNQERLAHLTARVPGRVEQVYAFAGDRVQANALLATIYSQQYLTAQSEFIQAHQRLAEIQSRRDTTEAPTVRAIFQSARRKLIVLGATDEDVIQITQTQAAKTLLEVRSPFLGAVTEQNEILGHYVEVGTNLFHVADLTRLWIIVDIYEKDLAKLKVPLDASIEVAAYPNQKFGGHLTRIFDVLDEKTRTVKARVEAHNPEWKLKPQMFATVTIQLGRISSAIMVPSKAIQVEGDRQLVFVAVDDSSFAKRYVQVGRHQDPWVEIVEGLRAGERIVTDGAFTIKSEFQKSELSGE